MSQNECIQNFEAKFLKKDIPQFEVGDSIKVHTKIVEGQKERIQVFSGAVIAKKGTGLSETFSVYRNAYGSSMERDFLLHSPKIVKVELVQKGKVRRAKLYYLRGETGKKAKIKQAIAPKVKEKKQQVKQEPVKEAEPKGTVEKESKE